MSFNIGGLLKSVVNPMTLAQLAMGPAGWASLAMRTIGSQIAMNVLSQVGQQLGLPQSAISMAQAAFANASGQPGLAMEKMGDVAKNFANELNLSPSQEGDLDRSMQEVMDGIMKQAREAVDGFKGTGKAKGFLQILAENLGKQLDKHMNKMVSLSKEIGTQGSSDKSKLGELNGMLSAEGQITNILSQALNNSIKSIGEAQSTLARKN